MAEFWQDKSLEQMSPAEWESLCDRCGRCCLIKLEDEDTGKLYFTNINCRHLQQPGNLCDCYPDRLSKVPDCLELTPETLPRLLDHLPGSCAYRRLSEGRPLAWWHPLVSGSERTVAEAGITVSGKVVSEEFVHPEQYPEHIIYWQDWQGEE